MDFIPGKKKSQLGFLMKGKENPRLGSRPCRLLLYDVGLLMMEATFSISKTESEGEGTD